MYFLATTDKHDLGPSCENTSQIFAVDLNLIGVMWLNRLATVHLLCKGVIHSFW